ncbi:MAG: hypothetical protein QM703_21115 [Gemmatales bacterium]
MRLLAICLAAVALLLCTETAKAQYYSPYVVPGQVFYNGIPGYYTTNGYGQSVWVPNPYYGTYPTPAVPYVVPGITAYYPYGYYRPYRRLFGGRYYR